MRKQKEIETDLAKIRQTQVKIQEEQVQLNSQEEKAQQAWEDEMLELGSSEMPKTIKAIKDRREELTAAGNAANRKLQALQFELDEYFRQEKVKGFGSFRKRFYADLEDIQKSFDELIIKLDELENGIHGANVVGIGEGIIQDFDIALRTFAGCKTTVVPELTRVKSTVDGLLSNKPTQF